MEPDAESRQVVKSLFERTGQVRRRVALMDSPWGDTLAAWIRQGYPTRKVYKEPGEMCFRLEDGKSFEVEEAGEYEEPVPAWEHFGYDMVGAGGWFDVMPLRGHSELEDETDEWEVRRNGAGAAFKYWKHKSGTPEHVDFLMSDRSIWEERYRPHVLALDPERVDLAANRKTFSRVMEAGVWGHFGHMFIWELMRQSLGDVALYEHLLLDKAWIHDYARVYTDFYKAHFQYLFDNVGMPDGVWLYEDLGYKTGLFASPPVLRDLIFPYYKEMVDFFHGFCLPVVLHTCGSTREALPLIVEAGFDGLNPMERKAAGNEPFAFAEEYGDSLVFVGGFDARIFESNDLDLIEREVRAYIEGMKERGARLVFASDHSISTNTQYASYRHAVEVYRDCMCYS